MSRQECPKCGEEFDTDDDQIVTCPECGCEGSTACCCPGGVGCICIECEEAAG